MKTSSKLGFILVCTAMSSAGIATENPYKGIEAICGDLGVMDTLLVIFQKLFRLGKSVSALTILSAATVSLIQRRAHLSRRL
ncbi:hypothetical protein V3481_003609 [Fusarium oxysporum f. sp. vasinfectum]